MPAEVLIQDPYYGYAAKFIDLLHRKYGMKTVAFYTDPAQRRAQAWKFPILTSEAVSANYAASLDNLRPLTDVLRARHDIAAVIPYLENTVLPASELSQALGLDWADPATLARFRNKAALKDLLRASGAGVRINATAIVESVADIRQECASGSYRRFVLKPNDGGGNEDVAFFDDGAPDADLDAYLAGIHGSAVLMEEFIGGDEYFVTGQTDAHGNITVVSVFHIVIAAANGRPNVHTAYRIVSRSEPEFAVAADYATAVISQTGLRRSPFHVDLKIDDRGACLIEAGARLAGVNTAEVVEIAHGGGFSPFDFAAHYYLSAQDFGNVGLDWEFYDAQDRALIFGVSAKRSLIYEVDGIAECEAMPGFVQWFRAPEPGQLVSPTVDLPTVPWSAVAAAPTRPELDALAAALQATVTWNTEHTGARATGKVVKALWIDAKKKAHEYPLRPTLKPRKLS